MAMNYKINLLDNSEKILAEAVSKQKEILFEWGEFVEGEAKANAPVDTGNLRNSITHEEDKSSTTIGSAVSYAGFVHEGVTGRTPKPFLRNAITQNEAKLQNIANNILKN